MNQPVEVTFYLNGKAIDSWMEPLYSLIKTLDSESQREPLDSESCKLLPVRYSDL